MYLKVLIPKQYTAMVNQELLKQRVNESKRNGGIYLNLENTGLTTTDLAQLMPRIAQTFPRLTVLNLSKNNLEELPENIGQLRQLTQLHANNNPLKTLPLAIVNFRNLTALGLQETQLSLQSLLYINTLGIPSQSVGLSENDKAALNRIMNNYGIRESNEQFAITAMKVSGTFAKTSVDDFTSFYPLLRPEQLMGIVNYSLPLDKLGIGLDANGLLSNNLPTEMPIPQLLAQTSQQIAAGTFQEAAFESSQHNLQQITDWDAGIDPQTYATLASANEASVTAALATTASATTNSATAAAASLPAGSSDEVVPDTVHPQLTVAAMASPQNLGQSEAGAETGVQYPDRKQKAKRKENKQEESKSKSKRRRSKR